MRAIRYSAAGGVVIDDERVLVLRRPSRDEVRLPKGHLKKRESAQEAALREVREESGYVDLEVVADLGQQVVEFNYQGTHVVRDERYYLMRLRGVGQAERAAGEDWDPQCREVIGTHIVPPRHRAFARCRFRPTCDRELVCLEPTEQWTGRSLPDR